MINNEFYSHLGDNWYTAEGDAIALLRIENRAKLPWVIEKIKESQGDKPCRILDIGCGAGFLTLALSAQGHSVTGVDTSPQVLQVGAKHDPLGHVQWVCGRAEQLPFADGSFEVVCLMDILEHIHEPKKALGEAARVLTESGILLIHTFNRTWPAWLFAVRGLDWFIKDSPRNIHDWKMFIKPAELKAWLGEFGLSVVEWRGIQPVVWSKAFVTLIFTRRVPESFRFVLGGALRVGYLACAHKGFLKRNCES